MRLHDATTNGTHTGAQTNEMGVLYIIDVEEEDCILWGEKENDIFKQHNYVTLRTVLFYSKGFCANTSHISKVWGSLCQNRHVYWKCQTTLQNTGKKTECSSSLFTILKLKYNCSLTNFLIRFLLLLSV